MMIYRMAYNTSATSLLNYTLQNVHLHSVTHNAHINNNSSNALYVFLRQPLSALEPEEMRFQVAIAEV